MLTVCLHRVLGSNRAFYAIIALIALNQVMYVCSGHQVHPDAVELNVSLVRQEDPVQSLESDRAAHEVNLAVQYPWNE